MTRTEMHTEVQVGLDKSNNLSYADLAPEVIDLFLNRSQDVLTENIYKSGDIEQIREIIKTTSFVLSGYSTYNYGTKAYASTFSVSDYLYYQSSKTKLTRTSFPSIPSAEFIENDHINDSLAKYFVTDNFNKPIFKNPKVIISTSNIIILVDSYTTPLLVSTGLIFEYIAKPVRIASGVNCELNDRLHRKVVDIAVNFFLENLESPRFEADLQLLQSKV